MQGIYNNPRDKLPRYTNCVKPLKKQEKRSFNDLRRFRADYVKQLSIIAFAAHAASPIGLLAGAEIASPAPRSCYDPMILQNAVYREY